MMYISIDHLHIAVNDNNMTSFRIHHSETEVACARCSLATCRRTIEAQGNCALPIDHCSCIHGSPLSNTIMYELDMSYASFMQAGLPKTKSRRYQRGLLAGLPKVHVLKRRRSWPRRRLCHGSHRPRQLLAPSRGARSAALQLLATRLSTDKTPGMPGESRLLHLDSSYFRPFRSTGADVDLSGLLLPFFRTRAIHDIVRVVHKIMSSGAAVPQFASFKSDSLAQHNRARRGSRAVLRLITALGPSLLLRSVARSRWRRALEVTLLSITCGRIIERCKVGHGCTVSELLAHARFI
eukprot:896053-Pleurochrysis_carterae.AAC.3